MGKIKAIYAMTKYRQGQKYKIVSLQEPFRAFNY